jgi:hypothetical protein
VLRLCLREIRIASAVIYIQTTQRGPTLATEPVIEYRPPHGSATVTPATTPPTTRGINPAIRCSTQASDPHPPLGRRSDIPAQQVTDERSHH